MLAEEKRLRELVAQQFQVCEDGDATDENCRESCSMILEAIGTFLTFHAETTSTSTFPLDFLRSTLSRILREIGPGDSLFRTQWIRILSSQLRAPQAWSEEALHLGLEFLPLALLPLEYHEEETNHSVQLVWNILESTIERNNHSATVVFHCLHRLVITNRVRKNEAFSFFLRHLHVPDKETAVKYLFDHATEVDDWVLAVESLRRLATFAANDDDDDDTADHGLSFTSSVVNILFQLHREGNHPSFFEEYLAILDHETHQDNHAGGPSAPSPKTAALTTLDLVILLFNREDAHDDHGPSVESMVDDMLAMGLIHSKILQSLTTVITNHLKDCWDDLIWLLLSFCSSPLRNPQLASRTQPLVFVAKEFGVDCFRKSDAEGKEQILLALLQFIDECLDYLSLPLTREQQQSPGNAVARTMCPLVLSSLLSILVPAAEMSPEIFPKHHHTIVSLLHCQELNRESVQAVCKLLVVVDNHSKDQVSMDSTYPPSSLFLLLRNLLFPDPALNNTTTGTTVPSEGDCGTELCVRGLMLVTEMFASSVLENEDVPLLWDFVRKVLLPPTNRLVNPRIGIEGLRTLRSIHAWSTMKGQDVTTPLQLNPGIFPTMTTILMNTRLVKYSGSSDQTKVGVQLGYTDRPACFQDSCIKQLKFHKMIFSFDALLNDPEFSSTSAWETSFRWTFDLIDTYLTLGRDKSKGKWIPHAWVEAPLEFRSTDVLSSFRVMNARQQRTIDIVRRAINEFDTCTGSIITSKGSLHRDFAELFKQVKKRSHRTMLAESLLRCAMSHCLGLAMSLAILWNTYAHYQKDFVSQSTETNQQRKHRLEATRLMQYQLAKIYDLVKKCEIMEVIFRGITTTNLRGKKRRTVTKGGSATQVGSLFETMDLHVHIQQAGEQLKSIIKSMTSTQNFLQTKILWFSLVDPSHDTLLIRMIQNESSSLVNTLSLSSQHSTKSINDDDIVIDLRLNILKHLIGYLQNFSMRTQPGKRSKGPPVALRNELADMQPFFAQCVRLAAFLSSKMCMLGTAANDAKQPNQIMTLTAYYFRLLVVSMEISLGSSDDNDPSLTVRSTLVDFGRFWSLYQFVMDSESPLTVAVVVEETTRRSFKSILNGFLKHLLVCRDAAVSTELLETLSILSLGGQPNDSLTEMVRVTWSALHSTFPSMEPSFTSHAPFAFIEALQRRCPGALASTRRTSRDIAVRETLLKVAFSKSKMMEKHFFLVDGMLRHWGFLVLAEEVTPITADHLHQLYTNIHSFLSKVNDMVLPKKSRAKLDISSDDDADYVPPKPVGVTRPELPESSVPGLDSKNFFTYFQILLDMTVSSAALFTIRVGSQWIDPLNGPFRELCKLVETFGYLVNLYRKRIHVFPQNMLSSVLNTCRSMLNVVNLQSTQSIEWRSSQPALTTEQIEAEVFDPASLQFLGRILDVFGVHVVGCLISLCESIETLSSPPTQQNGIALFGPTQNQRVKALRLKIDKISTLLDKFAEAHKLSNPKKSVDSQAKGEPARKRRRIEIKGFLQFEESAGESELSNLPSVSMDAGVQEPNIDESKTLSSELTWDEDESEDSFGADGDWGRESEEDS